MNNKRSVALFKRARESTPGGVHSPVRAFGHVNGTPVFMESADRARLRDADGHHYTDYCMAFGPLILGHRHPAVEQAALEALKDGWSFGTAEQYSLELAELVLQHVPFVEQIRFMNSGTEAVMTALRLARAATGRTMLLKFSGCYHGHTDAMLVEAGSGLAGTAASGGISASTVNETLVTPLDDTNALTEVFAANHHAIAAAIIEPLPANYGLLPQRQEFLQTLATLCKDNGSLLIFDEVISGFRLEFGGYSAASAVKPDIVTWGKILGGGFPVGAVASHTELMNLLTPNGDVYQAGTLSANPLAMRAGKATLKQLIDSPVYKKLETLGEQLEAGISALDGLAVQRSGSVFWLRRDGADNTPARSLADFNQSVLPEFPELFRHLLKNNIYLSPSPYEVNFLSAAHNESDIEHFIETCKSFLQHR